MSKRHRIRVLVAGACGQMGRQVVRAVAEAPDMALAAACDVTCEGREVGEVAGIRPLGVPIHVDLAAAIAAGEPEVMVDFTTPEAVMSNLRVALARQVAAVVGTTGLGKKELAEVEALCRRYRTPALVAPNFAIGAVLMMQFAAQASRHFSAAEIVELHHDRKRDAPSGTALRTAQLMLEAEGSLLAGTAEDLEPSRGLAQGRICIHSVRLPGMVAHQEVILGGPGQTLTIRHDTTNRECFMPGVLAAIRRARELDGLVVGLENLL